MAGQDPVNVCTDEMPTQASQSGHTRDAPTGLEWISEACGGCCALFMHTTKGFNVHGVTLYSYMHIVTSHTPVFDFKFYHKTRAHNISTRFMPRRKRNPDASTHNQEIFTNP